MAKKLRGTAVRNERVDGMAFHSKPTGTNHVVVTAATTSWAPAFGGRTTFNDTLAVVVSLPLRATLNWTGGAPPYRVQRATDLTSGDWMDFAKNRAALGSEPHWGRGAALGSYLLIIHLNE